MKISIENLDISAVLAVLHNAAKPHGMGARDPHYSEEEMNLLQARKILADDPCRNFDYLNGRWMKIDISGTEIDSTRYDKVNGPNAAHLAIEELRSKRGRKKYTDNPELPKAFPVYVYQLDGKHKRN
jgi:hypothetical protein